MYIVITNSKILRSGVAGASAALILCPPLVFSPVIGF